MHDVIYYVNTMMTAILYVYYSLAKIFLLAEIL
jgi:hypothetical protein